MRPSVLILLFLAALGAAAQSRAPQTVETQHVTVTTSGTPAGAPGSRLSFFVDVVPKPTMHVYAPGQKDLIPVSIALAASPAFRVHAPVFPKSEKYFFAPLKETQLVYSKPFRIVQDITLAPAAALRDAGHAAGSTLTISGKLRYQACDDAICYFPKDLPVSW